jgi:hypothetical protein
MSTGLRSEIKPGTAVLAVVIVLVLAAGGAVVLVRALTGSQTGTVGTGPATGSAGAPFAASAPESPRGYQAADSAIIERNLFRPSPADQPVATAGAATGPAQGVPATGPAKAVPATGPAQAVPPGGKKPLGPSPPGMGGGGPQLFCTGIVTIGDQKFALLESGAEGGVGQYTPVGGTAYGSRVTEIGTDYVMVLTQGKPQRLPLQNNKPEPAAAPPSGPPGGGPATGPGRPGGPPQPGGSRGPRMMPGRPGGMPPGMPMPPGGPPGPPSDD